MTEPADTPTIIDKTFDPAAIEARWYAHWEASGAFRPHRPDATPFTIVIPPPNVTGSLHLGHALDNTLQDVLIRYHRLKGADALWVVGTDHAGIATQMVVERQLEERQDKRSNYSREQFVEKVWDWKAESGGTITRQLRRLGASCDWSNERFTMDPGLNAAVIKVFVTLYEQGLLYRDKRLVNWDPHFKTAISDLEVEYREIEGHLWHFRYPLEDGSGFIAIATTRPETILGDGAVAVNPDDPKMAHFVGKRCRLPLVDRLIPIITDPYVEADFGSGAVKITAAHDFNDFEVYKRHPEANIPVINLMNPDATMSDACPPNYRGLTREAARLKVVADFDALGLLDKVEPHRHQVPYGDRSGVVIEPYLTDQWYVNAAELAKPAIAAVRSGATKFVPQTWEKTYFNWMENIQPWCVSRQLWWGHRIPAWYGPVIQQGIPRHLGSGPSKLFVAEDEAAAVEQARNYYQQFGFADVEVLADYPHVALAVLDRARDESKEGSTETNKVFLYRDEDVLDTWFSSALWPFATLGWPSESPPPGGGRRETAQPARVGVVSTTPGVDDGFSDADKGRAALTTPATLGVRNSLSDPDIGPAALTTPRSAPSGASLASPPRLRGDRLGEGFLARHYPTSVLVTGFDIIFFWVARMMMQGMHFMDGVPPFATVYCHGLVRDAKGQKMSKSKGNVVDPLILIDKYGADALRFTLTAMESQGRDIKLSEPRIEGYRNFATKLWNAARFCQSNGISGSSSATPPAAKEAVNRWIIGEVVQTAQALDAAMAAFRFDDYAATIYRFVWGTFCDWYLEWIKSSFDYYLDNTTPEELRPDTLEARAVAGWALDQILVMLHPVMPFITEELWHKLGDRGDVIIADWPTTEICHIDHAATREVNWVIGLVSQIRSIRTELNVPAGAKAVFIIDNIENPEWFFGNFDKIQRFARIIEAAGSDLSAEEKRWVRLKEQFPDAGTIQVIFEDLVGYLVLGDIIDLAAERARLEKAAAAAEKEAASLSGRLAAPGFVEKAKPEAIEKARDDLAARSSEAARLRAALARLG